MNPELRIAFACQMILLTDHLILANKTSSVHYKVNFLKTNKIKNFESGGNIRKALNSIPLNDSGTSLSSFKQLCYIGGGYYGSVYKVQKMDGDDKGCFYALKKQPIDGYATTAIKNEIHILRKLHYPFVQYANYIFKDSGFVYIVSKLMTPMDSLGDNTAFFTEEEAAFYSANIILALEYLHSKGIAFMDLHFGNMLLDNDGYIRLIDFGVSIDKDQVILPNVSTLQNFSCAISLHLEILCLV